MKRTLFLGIIVVAAVFGLVAYATAATVGTVVVSATLNPMTELTIDFPTAGFNGGANVDPGTSYTSDVAPEVTVKSNQVYSFSNDGIVASSDAAIEPFLSEASLGSTGTPDVAGVYTEQFEYTLNLTGDTAYTALTPGTLYTATYQYTAAP